MKAVDHDLIKQRALEIWEQSGLPAWFGQRTLGGSRKGTLDASPAIEAKATAESTAGE